MGVLEPEVHSHSRRTRSSEYDRGPGFLPLRKHPLTLFSAPKHSVERKQQRRHTDGSVRNANDRSIAAVVEGRGAQHDTRTTHYHTNRRQERRPGFPNQIGHPGEQIDRA